MQKNAYLLAKIGADTSENERKLAEMLPKIGNYPPGPLPSDTPPATMKASPRLRTGGLPVILDFEPTPLVRDARPENHASVQPNI